MIRALVGLAFACTAWGGTAQAADPYGLPPECAAAEPPFERIVTLAPNLAELAFAAGIGPRVIASVAWTDYPAAAAELPQVGDAFRIDIEATLALRPDLVLGWTSGNPASALARLRGFCIPVLETEPTRLADIASLLERLGELGGAPGAGREAAFEFRNRLENLRARFGDQPAVRYFYQVAPQPLYTVGGGHLVSRALAVCNGVNVFADIELLAPQVSREAVLAAAPEVILAPEGAGSDPLAAWRAWPGLPAVANEALYTVPADPISRAGPRILDAIERGCTLFAGHAVEAKGP